MRRVTRAFAFSLVAVALAACSSSPTGPVNGNYVNPNINYVNPNINYVNPNINYVNPNI